MAAGRLVMQWRKAAPDWLRTAWRLARAVANAPSVSPPLPRALLEHCRLYASREELVDALPKGGRVAEIGVDRGAFSAHILASARPAALHLIDIDSSRIDPAILADPRTVLHVRPSHEALASFEDDYFDWIYIDADHRYDAVRRDAAAAASKVRPGGYLVFNDFAHMDPSLGAYGVHRAVCEFSLERAWPFAFWAFQVAGLYDVALRRPQ